MKFNNKNINVSKSAVIGENVKIGDNVTIYDNVIIGDNTIIANDCIIGEPTNDYYSNDNYENPQLTIGANSLIRSHCLLYAGSSIGENFQTGHRVTIRENMTIGESCSIGTLSDIQGHSTMGKFCRLHSNVHIGQNSSIGNFVFIYPYVVFTNDPHPPSDICKGPTIGDYSQVAVGAIVLPGAKIGSNVLIGANSVVGGSVKDYSLTLGSPAKHVKDTRDLISRKTGKSHYPWPYNFSRNMPWQELGFDKWLKEEEKQ